MLLLLSCYFQKYSGKVKAFAFNSSWKETSVHKRAVMSSFKRVLVYLVENDCSRLATFTECILSSLRLQDNAGQVQCSLRCLNIFCHEMSKLFSCWSVITG